MIQASRIAISLEENSSLSSTFDYPMTQEASTQDSQHLTQVASTLHNQPFTQVASTQDSQNLTQVASTLHNQPFTQVGSTQDSQHLTQVASTLNNQPFTKIASIQPSKIATTLEENSCLFNTFDHPMTPDDSTQHSPSLGIALGKIFQLHRRYHLKTFESIYLKS